MSATAAEFYAVQMAGYGPPDVLVCAPSTLPPLGREEVRIRTLAAAVNHTDLEIRSGNWPIRKADPFPYVPGVEVVGEIQAVGDEVTSVRPGDRVITMMQGLGGVRGDRPGGYATHVTVNADAVALFPADIDPFSMAALGLGAVTAFQGLARIGDLSGRRILVTGAAGGVGSSAVAIARAQGASVVGAVSRTEQIDHVRRMGADEVLVTAGGSPSNSAGGFDGVFDTVGASLFEQTIPALRPNGILSLVGAVGGSDVRFDLWNLIRPITLTGYSTETLNGTALRGAIRAIAGLLRRDALPSPVWTTMPLQDAARAHEAMERRGVSGRLLLVP
jgi:NADPH2:quinone reductase